MFNTPHCRLMYETNSNLDSGKLRTWPNCSAAFISKHLTDRTFNTKVILKSEQISSKMYFLKNRGPNF